MTATNLGDLLTHSLANSFSRGAKLFDVYAFLSEGGEEQDREGNAQCQSLGSKYYIPCWGWGTASHLANALADSKSVTNVHLVI